MAPKAVEAELERIRKSLEIPPPPSPKETEGENSQPNSPTASPRSKRKSFLDVLPSAFQAAKALRTASQSGGSRPWKAPEVSLRTTISTS
ncbi:hypothetical protein C8Q70DRAFT_485034 [Cubamyces menziesii]|nr:hypothetical protein C8Q70DRAFT_485034 [Cubamyces menziesii]